MSQEESPSFGGLIFALEYFRTRQDNIGLEIGFFVKIKKEIYLVIVICDLRMIIVTTKGCHLVS